MLYLEIFSIKYINNVHGVESSDANTGYFNDTFILCLLVIPN